MVLKHVIEFRPLLSTEEGKTADDAFVRKYIDKIAYWYQQRFNKSFEVSNSLKIGEVTYNDIYIKVTYHSDKDNYKTVMDPDPSGSYPVRLNGTPYAVWSNESQFKQTAPRAGSTKVSSPRASPKSSPRASPKASSPRASSPKTGSSKRSPKATSPKASGGKRPASAYILFTKDHRKQVNEKYPNASFGETAKILGQMWRELSDAKKEKYIKMNKVLKDNFQPSPKTSPKATSPKSAGPRAKRAPNAYILFANDHRKQVKERYPNANIGDTGRILGEMWRALSDREKEKYNKKSALRKEELLRSPIMVSPKRSPKASSTKERVKRAPSAYIIFCNEKREQVKRDHPGASFGEIGKILGQMWRGLSEREKEKYTKKSNLMKEELKRSPVIISPKARKVRSPKATSPKSSRAASPKAKRAPNAYILFSGDHRKQVTEKYPGEGVGGTAKRLGEMWRALPEREKETYTKKSQKLRDALK